MRIRQSDVVRALLALAADFHSKDNDGYEALHHSLRLGQYSFGRELTAKTPETLQVLMSFGATWDAKCDKLVSSGKAREEAPALRICMLLWSQELADGLPFTEIPLEVIERSADSTEVYIDDLKKSADIVLRRKICIVGCGCAGKTSLVKSVTSEKPQLEHVDDRSIGIDHFPLRFSESATGSDGKRKIHEVTFWDFAGQDAYQVAHSLFFSPRTLYLVCVDLQAFTTAYLQASIIANVDSGVDFRICRLAHRSLFWHLACLQPSSRACLARKPQRTLTTTTPAPMETEGDPPVSTGPPPDPPPAAQQSDGSIAVTGAPVAAPAVSAPQGTGPPGGTPNAATPQAVEMKAEPVVLRLTLKPYPTPEPARSTPDSMDVFAETDASAEPVSPVSRRYHEDGDADMGEKSDTPPKKPFKSDLQKQARSSSTTPPARRAQHATAKPKPAGSKTANPSKPTSRSVEKQTGQASAAPVWSKKGAAQLRASLGGQAPPAASRPAPAHSRDVAPALAAYYACATRTANLRHDGDQRAMTALETTTLFKWMDRQIYLSEPPSFLTETHTSAERDEFADFDRDHLGYRLYGILPAGTTLSEGNAKYHFCYTALLANAGDPARRASLESMFLAAQVITSVPRSKIVIIRFVHPEDREAWRGLTFKMGAGSVTLVATDSLTTDVPRVGMDDGARELLYHVFAKGHSHLKRSTIRAILTAAAKMGVFDVQSIESQGLTDFSSQKWKIMFAQVTCPPALNHVRRIEADYAGETLVFDLQHPRAAKRAPCVKCLSIRHVTNDCTNKQAAQSALRYTLKLDVAPPPALPKLTAAGTPGALKQQLRKLRQLAAPELDARLRQEKKQRTADVKLQAKRDATLAAKEAAEEARAQRAIKRQAAEDRAERQLRLSKAAQREVTRQLAELQALARREALGAQNAKANKQATAGESGSPNSSPEEGQGSDGSAMGTAQQEGHTDQDGTSDDSSPNDSSSSDGGASEADALSEAGDAGDPAAATAAAATGHSEANAEGVPESSSPDAATMGNDGDTDEHTDGDADFEGDAHVGAHGEGAGDDAGVDDDAGYTAGGSERGESDTDTLSGATEDSAGASAMASPSRTVAASSQESSGEGSSSPEGRDDSALAAEGDERQTATELTPGMADESAAQAQTSAAGGTAAAPEANTLQQHQSLAIIVPAPPAVTGKRTAPPTPTSSDDEDERLAKLAHTSPSAPFRAEYSPIEVAESLTKLIRDAVARSADGKAHDGTAHARVDKQALAPATRRNTKKVTAPPRRRQLALSEFYEPESLAQAQARLEQEISARVPGDLDHWTVVFPSPALDAMLNDVRSPGSTAAWCEALQARVVTVPGDGACLYYALHCCRTGQRLSGLSITIPSYHSTEGNYYKSRVNEELLVYLEQMVSDGTVTLTDLRRRYFGATKPCETRTERRKALKAIRTFIEDVRGVNLAAKGLDKSQWAGDAELFATVWYIREPLFVLSQLSATSSTVRVIWLERTEPNGPERIIQLFPDVGEAYEYLRSFLCRRVLPTVVVHTTAGGGHYNALRFNEDFYKAWTADDRTGAAMRRRMAQSWQSLAVDASGSEYEPSHLSLLSSAVFQLSPDAPLPPPAHYGLLSALNPKGRRRSLLAALWDQAERLNFQAYRTWDDAQPSSSEPRSEPDSVEAGCVFWSTSIPQLVALLRALPYPEVAMSLMRSDVLIRLGNELNDLSAHGTVPDFVRAEDPVEARRQWARLVALVAVLSNDELIDLRCVDWLRQHPIETTAALHDLRLHNWTVVSTLANASAASLPTRSPAAAPTSVDRS